MKPLFKTILGMAFSVALSGATAQAQELAIWHDLGDNGNAWFQKAGEAFAKTRPGVSIKPSSFPTDQWFGRVIGAINTDSAYLALDRGAARLRVIAAKIGPARRVGLVPDTVHVAIPRGVRAIQRLLTAADRFELPDWVWVDRGLPVPAVRADSGWAGPGAIVTTGGTLIYSLPASGPLADSSYVMPGSIRVPAGDLAAIRENLSFGMRVYFF